MKLPISKKMIMLPGIGIVVIGIAIMGMRFMKSRKTPPPDQTTQAVSQDSEENDDTGADMGTATAKLAKINKEKKEKITTKLPTVYKQNAATIFKPLSSNELANMLKEIETEKREYAKRNDLLDFREKNLELLRVDLEAEKKQLDAIKLELNRALDSIIAQKVEWQKKSIQIDEIESKNIKKLAAVYKDMKPEKAAMIIKEMDEETAVKLLTMMDDKASAKVLESFSPALAVKLTERLKFLKSDFKSGKK